MCIAPLKVILLPTFPIFFIKCTAAEWIQILNRKHQKFGSSCRQGCISCGMCSYSELTKDRVLTSAYVNIFRTVTRNAVNKSVWRKKDCFWLPLNKHAMNIWLSSPRIRAHLSWRTGKHLHVLHVLRTYPTCSCPGYQDTTTYAALLRYISKLKWYVSEIHLCKGMIKWFCPQASFSHKWHDPHPLHPSQLVRSYGACPCRHRGSNIHHSLFYYKHFQHIQLYVYFMYCTCTMYIVHRGPINHHITLFYYTV